MEVEMFGLSALYFVVQNSMQCIQTKQYAKYGRMLFQSMSRKQKDKGAENRRTNKNAIVLANGNSRKRKNIGREYFER